jgi:hypothetical protein
LLTLFAQIVKQLATAFIFRRHIDELLKPKDMKKIVSLLLLALPLFAIAQGTSKLEQVYTAEEIATMRAADAKEVAYLEFKADKIYNVQDLAGKKDISSTPDISEINAKAKNPNTPALTAENFDKDTFNPLLYNLDIDNKFEYYRIGDTGQLLQIISEQRCMSLFGY